MFDQYKVEVYKSTKDLETLSYFIKKNHYLKSLSRGNKYVFVLKGLNNEIVGSALFGTPVGTNVEKCYSIGNTKLLELKRFVLKNTPKNTASWFMSKCMKYLKQNTDVRVIISYADPTQGHEGTIYKASNFKYLGKQKYSPGYMFKLGKEKFYQRNIYQPTKETLLKIKEAKENGTFKKTLLKRKHIFRYVIGENNL